MGIKSEAMTPWLQPAEVVQVSSQVAALTTEALETKAIGNPGQHVAAGSILQRVTKLSKALDDKRAAAKRPYLDAGREVDARAKELDEPLAKEKDRLAALMADYELQRDLANSLAKPDDAGVTLLEADGGTPYTRTTKTEELVLVEGSKVPARFLVPDLVAIKAAYERGELSQEPPWFYVRRKYKVSSR